MIIALCTVVSLKHGYEKGILSCTSVYTPCQFLCLQRSRVRIVVTGVWKLVRTWGRSDGCWVGCATLTGLGTDVHFTGEESGMLWEDFFFEDQTAAEWKAVMSRGADERT